MAEQDDATKTEEPSARKLATARSEGHVAQSQEIRNWMVLLAGAAGLLLMAPWMSRNVSDISARFIKTPDTFAIDLEHLRLVFVDVLLDLGLVMAPLMGLLMVMAFVSSVGQFGFLYAPRKIYPKLVNISLTSGVKRMISMRAFIEFFKGLIKIVVVAAIAFGVTLPLIRDIAVIADMELMDSLHRIHDIAIHLTLGTLAAMTVIAGLDFLYQKFAFMRDQRMSRQEVREEHRQSEGDPQVKARIRRIRMERARRRMMAAVPDADVVITNPTHFAVALSYDMGSMQAPKLVAKGADHVARRIREIAEENDVPIVENPPIARALYATVELDEEIPPEHYKAVAEIIGYVMRLRGELPSK